MFEYPRWTVMVLLCLLFAACGGNSTESQTDPGSTSNSKPPADRSDVLQQTPAAEILGSTVQRNLRYQPESETNQIMPLDTLLEYIRRVGLSLRREIGKLTPEAPGTGTVVVGLNAAGENRLWYVFPDEGRPSPQFKAAAEAAIAAVPKPKVEKSLVVFGVALTLWGYKETDQEAAIVELPKEWQAITSKSKDPYPATKLAEMTWGMNNEQ